jgi:hypothetical protein
MYSIANNALCTPKWNTAFWRILIQFLALSNPAKPFTLVLSLKDLSLKIKGVLFSELTSVTHLSYWIVKLYQQTKSFSSTNYYAAESLQLLPKWELQSLFLLFPSAGDLKGNEEKRRRIWRQNPEREKPIKWSETKLILLQANKQGRKREEVE